MKCKICHRECRNIKCLSSHLRVHKISSKDYYDKYMKSSNDGVCIVCGKETKFQGLWGGYHKRCSLKCSNSDKEKIKKQLDTCMLKYGGSGFKSEILYQKFQNTIQDKYGTTNTNALKIVKDKKKKTCLKNFGVFHPGQSKEVRDKIRETCQKNLGVDNPFKSKTIQRKIKNTISEKYGVDNISQTFENRKLAREIRIKEIEIQKLNGEPLSPNIGKNERQCLNELQFLTELQIQRNICLIGYFPDGYIEELKLVIEFDEPEHFINGKYRNKDIQKDKDLESIGCTVFRISESRWLNENEKEKVISEFMGLL